MTVAPLDQLSGPNTRASQSRMQPLAPEHNDVVHVLELRLEGCSGTLARTATRRPPMWTCRWYSVYFAANSPAGSTVSASPTRSSTSAECWAAEGVQGAQGGEKFHVGVMMPSLPCQRLLRSATSRTIVPCEVCMIFCPLASAHNKGARSSRRHAGGITPNHGASTPTRAQEHVAPAPLCQRV